MSFNQQQTTVRLADGTTRDLQAGEPVPAGAQVIRVRVPRMLLDGMLVRDDDEGRVQAREQAWQDMKRDLSNAWKGPATLGDQQQPPASRATNDKEAADEAHAAYRHYLSTAWQGMRR